MFYYCIIIGTHEHLAAESHFAMLYLLKLFFPTSATSIVFAVGLRVGRKAARQLDFLGGI